PGLQKPLDGDPAIHVCVADPASRKLRHDVSRWPRHTLDHRAVWRRGERTGAEYEHELLTIGPGIEGQNRFECLAADDQGLHRVHELIVAVWFPAARRSAIDVIILSG